MQHERWFQSQGAVRGVAIVTHGMNLRPERMEDFARFLASIGYDALCPAFTGHAGSNKEYLEVKAESWEADARRFHALAAERARAAGGVPLVLVAYSFTAAVFQAMAEELRFDRRIYLAPALATKSWYRGVIWFAETFRGFTYPSMNMKEYQVHPRSGSLPFVALDHFLTRWVKAERRAEAAPTLILMDPKDELLSYPRIMAYADERPHWRVERVSVAGSTLPRKFHHLIVDEPSLGAEEWGRATGVVAEFLRAK